MSTPDLFGREQPGTREAIGPCAVILRGFALPEVDALLTALETIVRHAPFRHMDVPNGYRTNTALTNCGRLGWTSDRQGYRYQPTDPQSGRPWPPMPETFRDLAARAAAAAGFADFRPDACLINRYRPDARLSLHQDKNERDFSAPIVSVSLGMAATFLFGGHRRADPSHRVPLFHGDVAIWGREDRLRYHGIQSIDGAAHPRLGPQRINLTFRLAGARAQARP